MKLESLQSEKFKTITADQMLLVKGGGDTPGGSEVIGQYNINVPCETGNGGSSVNYNHVTMTKIRVWSSDSISANGVKCYWGEGYGWVN